LSETTETDANPVLRRLFNLRRDQASPEAIDSDIRDGVKFGGTNLWVLMCAILIASIGLNVNSTAVIIGAILISPLMGPITGVGYGLGVQNAPLIRQSLRSMGAFVGISLAASTLYFLITPLSDASSELLARTEPAIWDVLIAFFGGAAGIHSSGGLNSCRCWPHSSSRTSCGHPSRPPRPARPAVVSAAGGLDPSLREAHFDARADAGLALDGDRPAEPV